MTQNKKIAITGGIGSGKSSVSKIITEMGYKVFSCDEIYSELLKGDLTKKIGEIFEGVIDKNGKLDRQALSKIVFSDSEKLTILTKLTNTEVINYALSEMEKISGTSFCEVPLLFENGFENLFDEVIVVTRSLAKRIESVKTRNNLSEEEVLSRINSQYNYENADFAKYYVIHNDGNFDFLLAETAKVIKIISKNNIDK